MKRIVVTPVTHASARLLGLAALLKAQRHSFDEWHLWTDGASGDLADVLALDPAGEWVRVSTPTGAYRAADGTLHTEPCFSLCTDSGTAYLQLSDQIGWVDDAFVATLFEFRESTRYQHAVVHAAVGDETAGDESAGDESAGDKVLVDPIPLHAFAWMGSEFVPFAGRVPLDAEEFLGRQWPERIGRPNAVCGAARARFTPENTPDAQPPTEAVAEVAAETVTKAVPQAVPQAVAEAVAEAVAQAVAEAVAQAEPATPIQPAREGVETAPAAPVKKRINRRRVTTVV